MVTIGVEAFLHCSYGVVLNFSWLMKMAYSQVQIHLLYSTSFTNISKGAYLLPRDPDFVPALHVRACLNLCAASTCRDNLSHFTENLVVGLSIKAIRLFA